MFADAGGRVSVDSAAEAYLMIYPSLPARLETHPNSVATYPRIAVFDSASRDLVYVVG